MFFYHTVFFYFEECVIRTSNSRTHPVAKPFSLFQPLKKKHTHTHSVSLIEIPLILHTLPYLLNDNPIKIPRVQDYLIINSNLPN